MDDDEETKNQPLTFDSGDPESEEEESEEEESEYSLDSDASINIKLNHRLEEFQQIIIKND